MSMCCVNCWLGDRLETFLHLGLKTENRLKSICEHVGALPMSCDTRTHIQRCQEEFQI